MNISQRLLNIFQQLLDFFGPRNWWPGDTKLEIIVGAVLTQNTSWKNVERAITNMKHTGVLSVEALRAISETELAEIIRPSGFYRQKAERLKHLVEAIHGFLNGQQTPETYDTYELRKRLLTIKGVGPETADSILLYAFDRPVFVVDSYTKRFLKNHGLYTGSEKYPDIQKFFAENLPADTYLFNEFHALIVYLCQTRCKTVPKCEGCPIENDLRRSKTSL